MTTTYAFFKVVSAAHNQTFERTCLFVELFAKKQQKNPPKSQAAQLSVELNRCAVAIELDQDTP